MSKKIILILIVLILLVGFGIIFLSPNTVDIYLDGENITVETHTFSDINVNGLNEEICDYTSGAMDNTTIDISTYKQGVRGLCDKYGLEDPKITVDSSIGKNQIPIIIHVDGTSMLPTLKDGQTVLINKTHNIHVGDIVVAESDEYGGIIKRVQEIQGDSIYLVSDNKNISYEYHDGVLYEVTGVTTWVNIDNITGVAIEY